MRNYLIAGNWKMNTTISEARDLAKAVSKSAPHNGNVIVLGCPPFVNIQAVAEIAKGTHLKVGAQNCYFEKKGAYTGEVSIDMLKAIGCDYIIIGHSERRAIFCESNELINKKVIAILASGLTPILCIGETLDERNAGKTFDVLKTQLDGCLAGVAVEDIPKVVVAYEPVWAIGTGVSATSNEVSEAHAWLRNYFVDKCGDFTAKKIYLLYGGSLSDANAKETLAIDNVDGGLIGGAALVAEKFITIINTAVELAGDTGAAPSCCCGCK
ncbi:MAG: triose-phosphate isomerase [Ignavibacteria bacterium]|jgi:triosephosphate isomerase|nr:triose-phosphate isomerase [Ignavibacteria bacterium]